MGLKCGIVGLPNVGKSTLFNALTNGEAAAENYPFCTIEPNVGVAPLADARLEALAKLENSAKVVPAFMEFVDIAGLVKGAAAEGAGLGNKFLAHIRETDGTAQVVRCFADPDITRASDSSDPLADIETINLELILADLATAERAIAAAKKNAKSGDKESRLLGEAAAKLAAHLGAGKPARTLALAAEEWARAKPLCLLTAKPMLYVANVGEGGFVNNAQLEAVADFARGEGAPVVAVCAQMEAEMAGWTAADKREFLAEMEIEADGLTKLARAAFAMLNLITYFTAGAKEARAWTIRRGMTAQEAAGVIHTDFARGFIRAETAACADFLACGGEAGARAAGKLRAEGRDYVVADGDVLHFRFNV